MKKSTKRSLVTVALSLSAVFGTASALTYKQVNAESAQRVKSVDLITNQRNVESVSHVTGAWYKSTDEMIGALQVKGTANEFGFDYAKLVDVVTLTEEDYLFRLHTECIAESEAHITSVTMRIADSQNASSYVEIVLKDGCYTYTEEGVAKYNDNTTRTDSHAVFRVSQYDETASDYMVTSYNPQGVEDAGEVGLCVNSSMARTYLNAYAPYYVTYDNVEKQFVTLGSNSTPEYAFDFDLSEIITSGFASLSVDVTNNGEIDGKEASIAVSHLGGVILDKEDAYVGIDDGLNAVRDSIVLTDAEIVGTGSALYAREMEGVRVVGTKEGHEWFRVSTKEPVDLSTLTTEQNLFKVQTDSLAADNRVDWVTLIVEDSEKPENSIELEFITGDWWYGRDDASATHCVQGTADYYAISTSVVRCNGKTYFSVPYGRHRKSMTDNYVQVEGYSLGRRYLGTGWYTDGWYPFTLGYDNVNGQLILKDSYATRQNKVVEDDPITAAQLGLTKDELLGADGTLNDLFSSGKVNLTLKVRSTSATTAGVYINELGGEKLMDLAEVKEDPMTFVDSKLDGVGSALYAREMEGVRVIGTLDKTSSWWEVSAAEAVDLSTLTTEQNLFKVQTDSLGASERIDWINLTVTDSENSKNSITLEFITGDWWYGLDDPNAPECVQGAADYFAISHAVVKNNGVQSIHTYGRHRKAQTDGYVQVEGYSLGRRYMRNGCYADGWYPFTLGYDYTNGQLILKDSYATRQNKVVEDDPITAAQLGLEGSLNDFFASGKVKLTVRVRTKSTATAGIYINELGGVKMVDAYAALEGPDYIYPDFDLKGYVHFEDENGDLIKTVRYTPGTQLDASEIPTLTEKEGYTVAWGAYDTATLNTYTVAPVYTANKYQVSINYQYADGTQASAPVTQEIAYGETYEFESPAIAGYTPNRTRVAGLMGANDVNITVTYAINTYTITIKYQYADGTKAGEDVVQTLNYNETYEVATPAIENYTADKATVSGTATEDKVITVTYAINQYTVTIKYQYADGTKAADDVVQTLNYNATYEVATPAIEGYTADVETVSGNATEDKVITVTYTINQYTITIKYQYADGTKAGEDVVQTLNYNATYEVATPAIEGYTADVETVSGNATEDKVIVVTYTAVPSNSVLDMFGCNASIGGASMFIGLLAMSGVAFLMKKKED